MDSKLSTGSANQFSNICFHASFRSELASNEARRNGRSHCKWKSSARRNTEQTWRSTSSPDAWEVVGLYRGMTSPMAGVGAVNAIVFGVYGHAQRCLSEPDRLSSHFLAGASAGIAQTPICSPIELAKTRLQLQSAVGRAKFSGPMHCLRHIYKEEGYRGVFRGFGITFLREAPSYGVYFLVCELLTRSDDPISTARMLLAGGVAGIASWVISYPLDVIKSRIQAESSNRYSGALDCFKQSVRAEGYACMYKGLTSTILRAFPTNAATFAVVTWTFRIFGSEPNKACEIENVQLTEMDRKVGYESFADKWRSFIDDASYENSISRPSYTTLSTVSVSSLISNCVNIRLIDDSKRTSVENEADERLDGGTDEKSRKEVGVREGRRDECDRQK